MSSALSMDAFIASFAYGSDKIKIPMISIQIINLPCSSILGISLLAGSLIRPYIPPWLTTVICFSLLFILGIIKLLDSINKTFIRKHNDINKEIHFSMFNLRFVLSLYADPEDADQDHSKIISPSEAVSLGTAISLDGIAVGFGAALENVNPMVVVLCSLVTNTLLVFLGSFSGRKVAQKLPFDVSWLSGAILIILAFTKVF